jgi:hypothetical protein
MNQPKLPALIIIFTMIVLAHDSVFPMQTEAKENRTGYIKGASYLVYEGEESISPFRDVIPEKSRFVTFYTADGEKLKTLPLVDRYGSDMEQLLDKTAKPQPHSCVLKWWPSECLSFGMYMGKYCWHVVFYDKQGNRIVFYDKKGNLLGSCHCYDREKHTISLNDNEYFFDESNPGSISKDFPLDLQKLNHKDISVENYPPLHHQETCLIQ